MAAQPTAAGMTAAQEDAAKKRIVAHMNADHHDSIILYLEHHHALSSYEAYNGRMTNINPSEITLECSGSTYSIPLNPPLPSLRHARERLVALDSEARKALDRSEISLSGTFSWPTGIFAGPAVALVLLYVFVGYRGLWVPGGVLEGLVGKRFAGLGREYGGWFLGILGGIHVFEVLLLVVPRLRKYSINQRTKEWWFWVVAGLVEGVFAVRRFDDLVEKKRIEKEKQKH